MNLREEPVLFVETASDMLPYSVREREDLKKLVNLGRSSWEADEAEARIRKEVSSLHKLSLDQVGSTIITQTELGSDRKYGHYTN